MPTDTEKKLNGAPEPFRRPMIWGRPPATVFRAGPLPKGERLAPLPEPPRARPTGDILSGSMIPRAAPARAQNRAEPPAPADPQPSELPVTGLSTDPAVVAPAADLTVRPLPAPEPLPDDEPRPEPVKPLAPLNSVASPDSPTAVRSEAERPLGQAPSTGAAVARPSNRAPIYAGVAVAAMTVLALGGWIWTRSTAAPPPPTETVAAPVAAALLTPVAEVPTAPMVAEPAPETPPPAEAAPVARAIDPAPTSAPAPPPAAVRPAAPAPTPTSEPLAPPPAIVAAPLVEIIPSPVPVPEPTAARPPQSDPDGPIPTRPQPLD